MIRQWFSSACWYPLNFDLDLCCVLYTEVFSPFFLLYSSIIVNRVTILLLPSKYKYLGLALSLLCIILLHPPLLHYIRRLLCSLRFFLSFMYYLTSFWNIASSITLRSLGISSFIITGWLSYVNNSTFRCFSFSFVYSRYIL